MNNKSGQKNEPYAEETHNKIDYNKLNNLLQNENWSGVLNCKIAQTSYNKFTEILDNYINTCSTKYRSFSNKSYKLKPWITPGLIKSIKTRDKLKLKLNKRFSQELKNVYKQYRNELNKIIRYTKNEYYKNKLQENRGNCKKMWEVINEITNKINGHKNIGNIKKDNKLLIDNKEKAETFNEYFINIGIEMAEKIDKTNGTQSSLLKEELIPSSIFLRPITENEIIENIGKLKNNCSPGPDRITTRLIKENHSFLAKPLMHIMNLSFETSIIPTQWKESIVTPVYKSGHKYELGNYRPISVICNFAKILEHCLKTRLTEFFERNNVITNRQYGFINNSNTELAVLDLFKKTTMALDNSERCLAIFLDLAKAFDTVSHNKLFDKLFTYGIRGPTLKILKNYLTHRVQSVKVGNYISEPREISLGVPQGTVLGPILFLIYINSISSITNFKGHLISYADDTAIVYRGNTWQQVYKDAENGLKNIKLWLNDNLLNLNVNKTKFITFTILNTDQPDEKKLNIHTPNCTDGDMCNCPTIEKISNIKYLGVFLDQHLRWDVHVSYIVTRLRHLAYKFYNLRDVLSMKSLLLVYNSLVESVLRYCITIWGGMFGNVLNSVQVIQNTIIKIIYKKSKLSDTQKLYVESNLLNVRSLYATNCLFWMYTNKSTFYMTKSNNTRSMQNLHVYVPMFKKAHTQRTIFYFGPKLYNVLPLVLKNNTHFKKYKELIKQFVIENNFLIMTILQNNTY